MPERLHRAISRRTLLVGAGGGALAATFRPALPGLPSAHAQDPTLQLDVIRPDDMLRLRLDFYNLELDATSDPPLLIVPDTEAPSHIVVTFPSQHLMEETVPELEGQPDPEPGPGNIRSQAVGPSRIAFLVPRTVKELPFTTAGLFDWRQFVMAVVPSANGGSPQEPGEFQTDLLLTDWLHLSPTQTDTWAHAIDPVTREGRTELWHTRLMPRGDDGRPDPTAAPATIRAVFTDREINPPQDPFQVFRADHPKLLVDTSLGQAPVDAELLLLSALGSSLELNGDWSTDATDNETGVLESWIHRAHLGRDNYVRVVERGFLFPFGNRAVRIDIAERKYGADGTPYLFKKSFIVVREPVKTYEEHRALPFERIAITTTVTPVLPRDDELDRITGTGDGARSFWIQVGPTTPPADLPFSIVGTDWAGRKVEFSCSLAFIRIDDLYPNQASQIDALVASYGSYPDVDDDPRRAIALHGQDVAFAAADEPGDTSYPVSTLYLGVAAAPDGTSAPDPTFLPTMLAADVRLPAVEVSAPGIGAASIGYDPAYVHGGFDDFAGLFARVQSSVEDVGALITHLTTDPGGDLDDRPVRARFSNASDKAGGVATPNLEIGGLSRATGPVSGSPAGISDLAGLGTFDPEDFFPTDAMLLGGIRLVEIIAADGEGGPTMITTMVHPDDDPSQPPTEVVVRLDWEPELRDNDKTPLLLDGPSGDTRFQLHGEFRTDLGTGTTTSIVRGTLTSFTLQLVTRTDLHFIDLRFDRFAFEQRDGGTPTFDIALNRVDFAGPLEFVNELREFLSTSGTGPNLDLQPTSISAGYTLAIPTVAVGVFTLQNISFSAGIRLPFDGGAVTATFGFASRENPFTVTYLILGGGGFFALELGSDGLHMLEAAVEFGGSLAIDIGVASGSITVMAGFYFRLQKTTYLVDGEERDGKEITLSGYVRVAGRLSVLGLISVSVELMLELEYNVSTGVLAGEASMKVKVEVLFFSKTVTVRIRKEFPATIGGSSFALSQAAAPEFGDLVSQDDWTTYCDAFAA